MDAQFSILKRRTLPKKPKQALPSEALCARIKLFLEDRKAENIVAISLEGKSSIADYLLIASGSSQRHISSIAETLRLDLKEEMGLAVAIEGIPQCDWVLIDAGDIIIHLFRPEVRTLYNLERMWGTEFASSTATLQ